MLRGGASGHSSAAHSSSNCLTLLISPPRAAFRASLSSRDWRLWIGTGAGSRGSCLTGLDVHHQASNVASQSPASNSLARRQNFAGNTGSSGCVA